jgi:hypothetical protein
MGAALRTPAAEWDSIYAEALRLQEKFIKTHDVSTKRIIFNQWITIKTWGLMLIERSDGSDEKRDALNCIHENLIKHNIGFLYTIDESFLQIPLLESS